MPNDKLDQGEIIFYVSPERINNKFDVKCDIWSCGVIFYTMICGYPPFKGKSNEETIDKSKK